MEHSLRPALALVWFTIPLRTYSTRRSAKNSKQNAQRNMHETIYLDWCRWFWSRQKIRPRGGWCETCWLDGKKWVDTMRQIIVWIEYIFSRIFWNAGRNTSVRTLIQINFQDGMCSRCWVCPACKQGTQTLKGHTASQRAPAKKRQTSEMVGW